MGAGVAEDSCGAREREGNERPRITSKGGVVLSGQHGHSQGMRRTFDGHGGQQHPAQTSELQRPHQSEACAAPCIEAAVCAVAVSEGLDALLLWRGGA